MKTVLTIAGSDSSGGAGIQADLKTMMANGVYGMSAITALTAQNTTGIRSVFPVTPEFLGDELEAVFTDIFPDAVKIGMIENADLVHVTAEKLEKYKPKHIVLDPVMVSSTGVQLIESDAVESWKKGLFPLATLLTPNLPEASILSGMEIQNREDMIRAAVCISRRYHTAVLCKGGHLSDGTAADYLCTAPDSDEPANPSAREESGRWFTAERISNPNTHGTGCTLSSAIASNLAKGFDMETSVERAKEYLSESLRAMLDLGHGSGPLNHSFAYQGKYMEEAGES